LQRSNKDPDSFTDYANATESQTKQEFVPLQRTYREIMMKRKKS